MTLILSGTDGLSDVDGSAATPAIRGTDANTGIFFGADIIGFAEGGAEVARFNADAQFVAAAGTASLPVITTTGDVNTGIFFPAADTIAFSEGGVESMRIDASGNVGVGATPSAWNSPIKAVQLPFGCAIATIGAGDVVVTQNAYFDTPNFKYASTTGVGSSVYRQVDGTHRWSYAASGTAGNNITFSEAMRIDSSGKLLVGTTSSWSPPAGTGANIFQPNGYATGNSSTSACFQTDRIAFNYGQFYVLNNSSTGVVLTNGSTAWAAQSDERTKDIIEPITNASEKVSTLRAVIGKYKNDEADTRRSFLIAQDVQAVLPEAVSASDDEDGTLNLRYSEVIPLLVAAIQEQQALITTLTDRITALEAK